MAAGYALNGYAILTPRDTWPIGDSSYRGACRGCWWPLRERDEASAERVSEVLQDALFLQLREPPVPDAIVDDALLRRYAEAADGLDVPVYGVLCASPIGRG